jgi:hypothetical protein
VRETIYSGQVEVHVFNEGGGADVWLALRAANGAASDGRQPPAGETSPA